MYTKASDILEMAQKDEALREQLAQSGELARYDYHPLLEKCHLENAQKLQHFLNVHGFPTLQNSDPQVVEACWLVIQHAISQPAFMKACLSQMQQLPDTIFPRKYQAYLSDRIAFYQRRPQRYGTQFDYDDNGHMAIWQLEDPLQVDAWRQSVGLPPLSAVYERLKTYAPISKEAASAHQKQMLDWLVRTGWYQVEDTQTSSFFAH